VIRPATEYCQSIPFADCPTSSAEFLDIRRSDLGVSELQAYASVEDTTVQRRPRIDCPSAVDAAVRPEHRIPPGLANIGEVFDVHKELHAPKSALCQEAEEDVRLGLGAIRVLLQTLTARVITFDADTAGFSLLPHADNSKTMTWN